MRFTIACGLTALMLTLIAAPTEARERRSFRFQSMQEGATTSVSCWEGLCAQLVVRVALVPGTSGRPRICAVLTNETDVVWRGAYRLTDRDVHDAFATTRVPAHDTTRVCENLEPGGAYNLILRRSGSN